MLGRLELLTAVLLRNRRGFATVESITRDLRVPRADVRDAVGHGLNAGVLERRSGFMHGRIQEYYELTDDGRSTLRRRAA